MAEGRLRVAIDANILIAGVRLPRWPYEVMRPAIRGSFDLVLPEQVITEAQRHLSHPDQLTALQVFLSGTAYEQLPMPDRGRVIENLDLVRSAKDVPIALSLMDGRADIFVTNDRDFTDQDATATRFRQGVRVLLAAVFLRDVLGWSSGALESIRFREWKDMATKR
jgi:predicted nucleic acid-binding protein